MAIDRIFVGYAVGLTISYVGFAHIFGPIFGLENVAPMLPSENKQQTF